MKLPRVSGLVVLAVALATLILALGAMQWRWVREASEADRVRMQTLVDARATQFAHDLDREVTAIYGWFVRLRRPGDPVRSQAERAAQWYAETARPQVVEALYVIRARRNAPLEFERFDAAAEAFVAANWPVEFAGLRDRLTKSRPQPGASPQVWRVGPRVDIEIPAVVISHPFLRWAADANAADPPDPDADIVATVATLNLRELRDNVLPGLAAKYFPAEPGFTFRLQIVDDRDHRVVFSAPDGLAPDTFRKPDATASLLRVRNEFLERVPGDRLRYAEYVGPPDQKGSPDKPGVVLDDGGPPRDGGGRVSRMQIVLSPEFANGQTVLVVPDMSPTVPRWTLSLVHAQGSLEAAVTRTRRWNLGVSIGVLALLAASVSLALVASQRAQRLARERMEFVAGISHELRTPLAVIRSAAENLADGVVDSEAGVQQYGTLIANEGRKLSDMVDQVLTFSTLESGHDLRLQPTSVETVVDQVARGLVPAAEAAGVRLEVGPAGPVPRVMADTAALGRVVANLVTNAIKYAASGGWVGVRVTEADGGRCVRIAVSDRGPGISHADQKRIFEPFFRGQEAVEAQIHGNGLGLDLVRRISRQHGGRVWVVSEPGKGATFTVELPAIVVRDAAEPVPADAATAHPGRSDG